MCLQMIDFGTSTFNSEFSKSNSLKTIVTSEGACFHNVLYHQQFSIASINCQVWRKRSRVRQNSAYRIRRPSRRLPTIKSPYSSTIDRKNRLVYIAMTTQEKGCWNTANQSKVKQQHLNNRHFLWPSLTWFVFPEIQNVHIPV